MDKKALNETLLKRLHLHKWTVKPQNLFCQHYWESQIFIIMYNYTTRPLFKVLKNPQRSKKIIVMRLKVGEKYWWILCGQYSGFLLNQSFFVFANFDATEAGQQGDGSVVDWSPWFRYTIFFTNNIQHYRWWESLTVLKYYLQVLVQCPRSSWVL